MKPQRQYKFCINKRSLCIYFRISLNCLVLVHFLFLCSRICRVKPQYSWVPSLMVVKRCQKFQFNNKSSKKEKAEFFVCFIFSLHLEYNDSWMLKIIIVEKSYRARVINGNQTWKGNSQTFMVTLFSSLFHIFLVVISHL